MKIPLRGNQGMQNSVYFYVVCWLCSFSSNMAIDTQWITHLDISLLLIKFINWNLCPENPCSSMLNLWIMKYNLHYVKLLLFPWSLVYLLCRNILNTTTLLKLWLYFIAVLYISLLRPKDTKKTTAGYFCENWTGNLFHFFFQISYLSWRIFMRLRKVM